MSRSWKSRLAALSVLTEFENRARERKPRLVSGHAGEPLSHADLRRQVLSIALIQERLVIEQVQLRWPACHEQVDDPLRLRRKMRLRQDALERILGDRRIRIEDGTTQPVEGLVVLPPGSEQVPDHEGRPSDRRRETRPTEPGRRQPRPSETRPADVKPAEPAKPVETAKPAEPEPAAQAEAPRPPRDPAGAHSALTEDLPAPPSSAVQEIPL